MNEFVICPKCGWKNPKREVFCLNCHRILSEMAINKEQARRRQLRSLMKLGFVPLFVIPFVVLGMALAPKRGMIGEMGSAGSARRTAVVLSGMHKAAGQNLETGRDLAEGQVNAYFKHLRTKALSFDELSVDFVPDRMHLRVTNKLGPWFSIEPRLSRDFTLSVKDGKVAVEKASVGHLPLVWAFRPGAFARFLRKIQNEPELKLLAKARAITLYDDYLHITFGGE